MKTIGAGSLYSYSKPMHIGDQTGVTVSTAPTVTVIAIQPNHSLYDDSGNVIWTNNSTIAVQPGVVVSEIDMGNGTWSYKIDTTAGTFQLNMGILYTKPTAFDVNNDPDEVVAYYNTTAKEGLQPQKGSTDGGSSGSNDSGPSGIFSSGWTWGILGVLLIGGIIIGNND